MQTLFEGIHLLGNGKYVLPYCNCLWLEDEINCLIDSSFPDEELAFIEGKKIDLIVNTHGHSDHCSRNVQFPEARILMHPADNNLVESGDEYLTELGFYRFNETQVRPFYLDGVGYNARQADAPLADGEIISTGRIEFQVLHLPGHSQGHCGFFFKKEGFIFTGDILLDPFDTMFFNLHSNVQDFIDSVEKIRMMKPEMLIRGHGRGVINRDIPGRLEKYRDKLLNQSEQVLKGIAAGHHTIDELASLEIVLGSLSEPRSVFFLHEQVMILKHVERLQNMGRVVEDEGCYYLAPGVRTYSIS